MPRGQPKATGPSTSRHEDRRSHNSLKTAGTIRNDTEEGMLSGISQKNNMRSGSCRFTEFCNSQCLSHFAAPFNAARAETSIAESCVDQSIGNGRHPTTQNNQVLASAMQVVIARPLTPPHERRCGKRRPTTHTARNTEHFTAMRC